MQVGIVGGGKMGAGMARRLSRRRHEVVIFDQSKKVRAHLLSSGLTVAGSLAQLISKLTVPRVVWLMLPAGEAVTRSVAALQEILSPGDIVIEGGNSYYEDSIETALNLKKAGILFLDIGVSGGIAGEEAGYAFMVGGEAEVFQRVLPLVETLAASSAFLHVGPVGAGHFVKMVHNAIEYGMMQAISEGFALLEGGPYKRLDLAKVASLWNNGTIIRSFLIELTAHALSGNNALQDIAPYVADSGEGRWSVATAVKHGIPFSVNTAALYARFTSQERGVFANKLLAALRRAFGGHSVKKL
jgi:6-phosphogluconate dehydrogenase